MFTGIIKEVGKVIKIEKSASVKRLSVRSRYIYKDSSIGDSISVDGVCLTLVDKTDELLHFNIIDETLKNTTLDFIKPSQEVNLEPSLVLSKGLGGHILTGHIDDIGVIRRIRHIAKETRQLFISINQENNTLLVPKGSIAVDGISLTINEVGKDFFAVDIIPHTLKVTTMGSKKKNDRVNIEFDIIGKYVLNYVKNKSSSIDRSFLKEHGFV